MRVAVDLFWVGTTWNPKKQCSPFCVDSDVVMVALGKAFAFAVKPVAPILTCHPFPRWPLQGVLVAFDGRFPSAHGIKVRHGWVPAVELRKCWACCWLRYTHSRPMSSDRSGERSDDQNAVSSESFYLVNGHRP